MLGSTESCLGHVCATDGSWPSLPLASTHQSPSACLLWGQQQQEGVTWLWEHKPGIPTFRKLGRGTLKEATLGYSRRGQRKTMSAGRKRTSSLKPCGPRHRSHTRRKSIKICFHVQTQSSAEHEENMRPPLKLGIRPERRHSWGKAHQLTHGSGGLGICQKRLACVKISLRVADNSSRMNSILPE